MLGTAKDFRQRFEGPILRSRDSLASDTAQMLGEERLKEMSLIVNKCIIRRTSALLTKYLPVNSEICIFDILLFLDQIRACDLL